MIGQVSEAPSDNPEGIICTIRQTMKTKKDQVTEKAVIPFLGK
jgi:hypothetical protein